MKINELIAQQGNSTSFEFFPPKTAEGFEKLFTAISKLEALNPAFVSVTYGAGGSTARNTRQVIERILKDTPLVPMPHLTCINQSEAELKNILLDYHQMGVENVLALRGDLPEGIESPVKTELRHAADLVRLIASSGVFSIGVAVYPEGHPESGNLEEDIIYTKEKIEAGADFAITQMFFDNRYFYEFMDRAGRTGIHVPIIPGIMPVTDLKRIRRFARTCGATLPGYLVEHLENATSQADVRKIGIDFATRQCEDLWKNGVRYFHFYTLNWSEAVSEILHNLEPDKKPVLHLV